MIEECPICGEKLREHSNTKLDRCFKISSIVKNDFIIYSIENGGNK